MTRASTSRLDALAERCGIIPKFTDARGKVQTASAATRRALLRAMGIEADSEPAAEAALERLEKEEWTEVTPPISVLHQQSELMSCEVTLPKGTASFRWRIVQEEGTTLEGVTQFDGLPLIERRSLGGEVRERRRWNLSDLACGYHELVIEETHRSALAVAPPACWLPPALHQGERLWGVSTQLYLLKSGTNWGIGDYGDLQALVRLLLPLGAHLIGLNPLHALFLDCPEHASPYSPASRLLLNALNIDVSQVAQLTPECKLAEPQESPGGADALAECRAAPEVDYRRVTELKVAALQSYFAAWARTAGDARWQQFQDFCRNAGPRFDRDVAFLALRDHFACLNAEHADWRRWPTEFQTPEGPAVKAFVSEHQDAVTWHAWLQYIADAQLADAAMAAKPMAIGLYRDLAVGADGSGAETWANPRAVVQDARVGAPPDIYNPAGQNWGLPPFSPRALKAEAYESFIALIRANMRHAGGLRIDHVMALQQLYWVPVGASAADGAYVRYPLNDLVGILKLESTRQQCLVVGEDLGTVPEGFREHMAAANILSYRVLFFEKDKTGFIAPAAYPKLALAVEGSHDLPTLRAWWEGADIELKTKLQLYPAAEDAKRALDEREQDRRWLTQALYAEGLIGEPGRSIGNDELFEAAHRFLARTASAIALLQLDDVTDEIAPVNVPTTSDEHPNWRRKLSLDLDEIRASSRLQLAAELFREER